MPRIKKTKVFESIFLLEFVTQYELAATFLRFQEYYESRRFHGRVFSLEDYMDWYASTYGSFAYYEEWDGFNIPSLVLRPFREGKFDPLLKKERQLLKLFENEVENFYIIGLCKSPSGSRPSGFKHELSHALFHLSSNYKSEVLAALRRFDTSRLTKALWEMGYCRKALKDEVHAYVLTGGAGFGKPIPRRLLPLKKHLERIYRRHYAKLKRGGEV